MNINHTAIAAGLLAAAVALIGIPPWPPGQGIDKFVYLVAGGAAFGLLLDLRPAPPRVTPVLGVIWLGGMYAWLAWPQLDRPRTWWLLSGLAVAGVAVVIRTTTITRTDLRAIVMLLMAALGLGGIALNSGSLVIAQLALALAASVGGFALWNWPTVRFPLGAAAIFGAGVPLLGLSALTLLLTDAYAWALAPLVLVFFADFVSDRIPPTRGRWHRILAPVYLALIAALPAALAVVLALLAERPDELYYR